MFADPRGTCVVCGDKAIDGKSTCGRDACAFEARRRRGHFATNVSRLLEAYDRGERVRAVLCIVDIHTGAEVAEGTIGVIEEPRARGCMGLARIAWDGGACFTTSTDNVEPADRAPNLGEGQLR